MRPVLVGAVAAAAWATQPTPAWAQQEPRSRDYLFITSVDDVRSVWLNPAGLGRIPEASVMGEIVVDHMGGSTRLSQYTLGLNSRGLGLSYERDRSRDSVSVGAVRIALALPFRRGAIGASMTTYGKGRKEGYDIGLRYGVLPSIEAGLTVRNINRPQVALLEAPLPVVALAGASWVIAPQLAMVSGEAIAVERVGAATGFDMGYRGGLVLRARRPWPLALHAAALLSDGGALRQWSVGLVVGGLDRIGVVTSAEPFTGLGEPERFSAVGVASRRAPAPAPPR